MKLLTLDIETSPNLAMVWGLWNQNVSLSQLRESTKVICFAAKWHGSREVLFSRDISDAFTLLEEADAVVTWNGDRFDIPHLNREFLEAGLGIPSPFASIDLLKTARKRFKFPSNKLDYVAQRLGVGAKLHHTGFQLWLDCMAGDEKAWKLMERYNKQDVRITEKVYDKLLPWIHNHPNPALVAGTGFDTLSCTTCGSPRIQKRGFATTAQSIFQQYNCQSCGKWFRGTRRVGSADMRGV